MAETAAEVAFGITLHKGGAAIGDAYSDWGLEIVDVTAPGFSRTAMEASHHASPNGWGEVIMSGLKRQKPINLEVNWIVGDTGTIKTQLEATSMVYWKINFPDGSSVITKAGISDFQPSAAPAVDGKMAATLELSPTGEPTWA